MLLMNVHADGVYLFGINNNILRRVQIDLSLVIAQYECLTPFIIIIDAGSILYFIYYVKYKRTQSNAQGRI